MAETFLENVKLKIGTETQFQEKLKDLPIGTLVGTTDPIDEGDLSTDVINKLAAGANALPKPTNQTTGSAGQILTKTASGSEWKDAPSSGSTVTANPSTDATATLTKLSVDGTTYSVPQATTGVEVVQTTGTSTTAVMSQKAVTDALSGKQATLSEAQLNAANSGITAAKVTTYDGYASTIAGKVIANTSITGATKAKITYDSKGLVTGGADLTASDIPALDAGKITSGTFADARIASAATWNAKYSKPSAGIPKSDLASAVQTSLGKADTALQEHQSLDGKQDELVSGKNIKTINGTSILGSGDITTPNDNQKVNVKIGSTTYGFTANDTITFASGDNVKLGLANSTITISATGGSSTDNNQTIGVGSTTFGANATVKLAAGNNVTLTPSSSNNTITIAATQPSLSNYVDKSSAQTIGGAKSFSQMINANGGVTSTGTIAANVLNSVGGTIVSGLKTYTLPSSTGTVALTSDIKIKSAELKGTTLTLTILGD